MRPIKNYTSGVPIERTIGRIETMLAETGAASIHKDFEHGKLVALCFHVLLKDNRNVTIRLPANAIAVYETLRNEVKRPRKGTLDKLRLQAERTAWKLMEDWIAVQVSLIRLQQSELLEVFLPYVWDGSKTLYHAMKRQNFLALPETTS